jgi:hypothetical protein
MSDLSKPNLNPPVIEQRGEYRVTTRQGSQPAPPDAARALKGTQTLQGIQDACDARRKQSESWSMRDTGKTTPGHSDHK